LDSIEDGRVARRLENRVRILDGLFLLIRGGQPHPTLKQIAEKVGVTPRTVLNHFPDMGSLLQAAATRWREVAQTRLPAIPDHADPELRIAEFFRNAARFYDAYAAVCWATATFPGFETRQHKGVVLSRIETRVGEMLRAFGVVLEHDPDLRKAVLLLIDPLAWRLLRVQQALSRSEAAATLARCLIALARTESAHDSRS
jgi:AcrR family transcriptional regulator